ncbi:putative Rho GTPase activation protein [Rosa chinensis]|uniref:Putative Rho GTPase activation protein n=1 Tax=Rosa chinensis TaxID=74649 RepID=A0A2P6RC55_ROSCH|nr:rho GTPase-activating protein 5 [Rosa chinensis]PRQ43990.1 putative Rho GTPase activation protein [Rosa chinensis]
MTEVLQSPSHFPSPSSSSPPTSNDGPYPHALITSPSVGESLQAHLSSEEEEQEEEERKRSERDREGDQLSLLTLLVAAFRKSLIGCSTTGTGAERAKLSNMEIGWPSNVRHVAHVTFDRFNGFLGLPVELEPEVPRRAPSASANVFGVSTESMQLSFDARGNSVPTILILMQRHLYAQGGLQAEGIFRINGENSQEEYVRDQLNKGIIPEGVDMHCLAGLIKAWFRELPTAVLDSLSPEQVMQSQTEEECAQLVRLLPPTEAALLDWAVNLMADVAQMEHLNKMNARNIAMVFAPNMTQMVDPLTALMYAVQVMNFLKTLIVKTLREREESMVETAPVPRLEPSDEDEHQSTFQPYLEETNKEANKENEEENVFVAEEPALQSPPRTLQDEPSQPTAESGSQNFLSSIKYMIPGGNWSVVDNCPCEVVSQVSSLTNGLQEDGITGQGREAQTNVWKSQPSVSNLKKGSKVTEQLMVQIVGPGDKSKRTGILSRINSRTDIAEGWR